MRKLQRSRASAVSVLFVVAVMFAMCVTIAPSAWSQSTSTGTVVGTVTDATGAVVSDAAVTLSDTSTKSSRSVTTNAAGRYIFVDVGPSTYDLTVSKQGFSTTKTQATVEVGQSTTLNMTLQVGGSSTVVEVTAVGNELQTMNATVGNTITNLTIDSLPSLGRDVREDERESVDSSNSAGEIY